MEKGRKVVKLLSKMGSVFDYMSRTLFVFAGLLVVFDMIIISIDVVMRNTHMRSLLWITEVTEFTLLFTTFLGAAWVLRRGEHIKLDFFVNKFSKKVRELYLAIIYSLSAAVLFIVTYYGAVLTAEAVKSKDIIYTLLEPPKWIFMAVIAFGSFIFGVEFVIQTSSYLKAWKAANSQKDVNRGV